MISHPKIAVIGAGVAGLTAAHDLIRRGHTNVSVFESESHVGGKVYTSKQIKDVTIDMGAIWMVPGNYRIMMAAARRHGCKLIPFSPRISIHSREGGSLDYPDYLKSYLSFATFTEGAANFAKIGLVNNKLIQEGLHRADPSLFVSMQTYCEQEGISNFLELLGIFTVGGGYSYLDLVPSVYLMRGYETLINMLWRDALNAQSGLELSSRFMIKGGFQNILQKMAASLPNIRTNARVIDMEPTSEEKIKIIFEHGKTTKSETYNSVFLSTPLPTTQYLLRNFSQRLSHLPSIASHVRYGVTAFTAEGLEAGRTHFLLQNNSSTRMGHVNTILGPDSKHPYFVAYQILGLNEGEIDAQSNEKLIEDLQSVGAKNIQILEQKIWKYFYHVPVDELKKDPNVFKRLDASQGSNEIYIIGAGSAGELEISENVAQHALRAVKKYHNTHSL